jgi:hypothetical protein
MTMLVLTTVVLLAVTVAAQTFFVRGQDGNLIFFAG